MIKGFEKACGHSIPYEIAPRRPGDIAACWADPSKAERELGWKATLDMDEMCKDAWHWQQKTQKDMIHKEDVWLHLFPNLKKLSKQGKYIQTPWCRFKP